MTPENTPIEDRISKAISEYDWHIVARLCHRMEGPASSALVNQLLSIWQELMEYGDCGRYVEIATMYLESMPQDITYENIGNVISWAIVQEQLDNGGQN